MKLKPDSNQKPKPNMNTVPNLSSVAYAPINDQDIKGELITCESLLSNSIKALADAKIAYNRAEYRLKYTRSLREVVLRTDYDNAYPTASDRRERGITEDRIKSTLEITPEVVDAHEAYLTAEAAYIHAAATVDVLAKRKDILASLAGLTRTELEVLHLTP